MSTLDERQTAACKKENTAPASDTPTIEQVRQIFIKTREVIGLICRVVAKFPAETLPSQLKPFSTGLYQGRIGILMSENLKTLTVYPQTRASTTETVQIPLRWLYAPQSEITSEIRDIYWRARPYRLVQQAYETRSQLSELEKAQARNTEKQIKAREQIADLETALKKYPKIDTRPLWPTE